MRKSNRKGFTIVELVIVIAVIAILAAVLIPTFASIIKKANLSSDQSAVRNMNTALAADTAVVDAEDLDLKIVIDALDAAGFNAKKALIPTSSGHIFYWYKTYNKIVLAKDGEVVYPVDNQELVDSFAADLEKTGDDQVLFDLEGGYKYVDIVAKDVKSLSAALEAGNENITLSADVQLKEQIKIPAGADVTIDLNGKKLTTVKTGGRSKYLDCAGNVTIVNGTFEGRGVEVLDGGKLTIGKDAKVTVNNVDSNGGAALWIYAGGEVVVDGGEFAAINGTQGTSGPGVINNSGKLTINGGKFTTPNSGCYAVINEGETTINGGDFSGWRGVIAADKGTITINGGKFTKSSDAASSYCVYSGGGKVVINAGEFNAPAKVFCVDTAATNGTITVKSGVKVNGTALTADVNLTAGQSH